MYTEELLLILLLLTLNGFFAMAEIALITIRRSRLRRLVKEGNQRAARALRVVKDSSRFLSTIQIGITFAGFLASASAAVSLAEPLGRFLSRIPIPILSSQGRSLAVLLTTALTSYLSLVFGELVPKQIALRWTERVALLVAGPIEFLGKLASPLVRFLSWSTNTVLRITGASEEHSEQRITEDDIRQMVSEHKLIEEEEKLMIEGVFEFGETRVKEIMVPRTDIVSIDRQATVQQALELVADTGFSRFPVTNESLDSICGILNAKDLMAYILKNETDVSAGDIARAAYFVPESKKALDLLKELQRGGNHMAIVIDEYGGTAGLVTMEILLEQIVGDIHDEYDKEEEDIQRVDEGQAVVHGDADIEDVNRELGIGIEESGEYETMAGFVLSQLEHIPKQGERFEYKGWVITVVEVKDHRITKLKLVLKGKRKE